MEGGRVTLRIVMGFIACADDVAVSADDEEADRQWGDTGEALEEIGLEIGQSCYTKTSENGMEPQYTVLQKRRSWCWELQRLSGIRRLLTKTRRPRPMRDGNPSSHPRI